MRPGGFRSIDGLQRLGPLGIRPNRARPDPPPTPPPRPLRTVNHGVYTAQLALNGLDG
jgi:hypothetical protein